MSPDNNATPEPVANSPMPEVVKPSRKFGRKSLILIIAAVAVVVLGGGAAAAYNLYYQNPNKVLSDALINIGHAKALETSAQLSYSNQDVSVKLNDSVTYDQQAVNTNGNVSISAQKNASASLPINNVNIDFGGYVGKDGSVLIKLSKVDDLLKAVLSTDTAMAEAIAGKIDNKWISFDATSAGNSGNDKTQQCFADAYSKFDGNKNQQNELLNTYRSNLFLVVDKKLAAKTIDGVGSLGYQIHLDEAKYYAFGAALRQTAIGQAMLNCDHTALDTFNKSTSGKLDVPGLKVYVSRFTHQLQQVSVSYDKNDQKWSLTADFKYDSSVKTTKPTADTSYESLVNDIENILMGSYTDSSTGAYRPFGV